MDFSTKVKNTILKTPFIVGSCDIVDTYENAAKIAELGGGNLGAIIWKSTTMEPREGYREPITARCGDTFLVASGMRNTGIKQTAKETTKFKQTYPDQNLIVSLASVGAENPLSEFVEMAKILTATPIDGIELNLSCPHQVPDERHKTELMAQDENKVREITSAVGSVLAATEKFLSVKLTGWGADIARMGVVAQQSGADVIVVSNTFPGTGYYTGLEPIQNGHEYKIGEPLLGNFKGGYAGLALLPAVLLMIGDVRRFVSIPIWASGGAMSSLDGVVQAFFAGANAVMSSTFFYDRDGKTIRDFKHDLQGYCTALKEYAKTNKEGEKYKNADEIERKFLINPQNIPAYLLSIGKKQEIEQAYLQFPNPENPVEKRIRKVVGKSYAYAEKTWDFKNLISRQENETHISEEEYKDFMTQRIGEIISKTRYKVLLGGHIVELDFYKDNLGGLVVAEVEFPDLTSAKDFLVPKWFGREVTENESYKNASLAKNGLPETIKSGKVYEIVLTGGPNGGKSTFLSACSRVLEEQGIKVIAVPEAATQTMESGIYPMDIGLLFQEVLTDRMLANERTALKAAKRYAEQGKNTVVFYDRGICDNKAYCSKEQWREVLDTFGLADENLRQRYDGVLNIVSTAYGAEEVWEKTLANNPQRYEKTVEQGRLTEDRTQRAWAGHHNLKIVGNDESGWDGKAKRLFDSVYSIIGLALPVRMERKFIVDTPADLDVFSKEHNCVIQSIEQTYLKQEKTGVERRVRKIESGGGTAYYYTEKEGTGQGRVVREYMPRNEKEYQSLLAQADPQKTTIKKTRYAFTSENQHFALDIFPIPGMGGKSLLELKGMEKTEQKFIVPKGLTLIREVTDDARFVNAALADR